MVNMIMTKIERWIVQFYLVAAKMSANVCLSAEGKAACFIAECKNGIGIGGEREVNVN